MYAFYLLLQNGILSIFFLTCYDSLQLRFIYYCLFSFTGFTQLKQLFRNVYLKRFPTRSYLNIFPMFYSVANISELQSFRNFYSQEHLLMADSDKNVCDKQLDLLIFPRHFLKFGFNIVIGMPQYLHSKCCFNNHFVKSCCYIETSFYSDKIMIYNVNCSTGFHVMLSLFLFFDF